VCASSTDAAVADGVALVDDASHRSEAISFMRRMAINFRGTVPASGARNPGIDLLRGLSILFVILNHLGLRIPLR
jgi:hypothetical protein